MSNPFSEEGMPVGLIAELDQHKANVRTYTDELIVIFANMIRDDPKTSQDVWAMLMEVVMKPGQLAVLAAELLFRDAREKVKSL